MLRFGRSVEEAERSREGRMKVNRDVHGGHGSPISQQIWQARSLQRQRELRLDSTDRNFHQRSLDQGHSGQCSDILSRKDEIFMKAGRLAAEYLVSRGVLSPSLLPRNQTNAVQENFEEKDGDFLEPTTSIPAQTGKDAPGIYQSYENRSNLSATWYLTNRRRREFDSRRFGFYQRRDAGRTGQSLERTPWNPYTECRDEVFPPGFGMSRRRGFFEPGENVSRFFRDDQFRRGYFRGDRFTRGYFRGERFTRGYFRGERFTRGYFRDDQFTRGYAKWGHRSETGNYRTKDDAILKEGSARSGKDHPQEADLNLNEVGDNGSSVVVDTLRGNMSGALGKEDVRMDDHQEREHEHSLLKLTGPAEVPKEPHLSLARRNQKFSQVDQGPISEVKTTSKAALKGVSMFVHHDKKTDERCSRHDHISGPRPEKENCGTTDDTKTKGSFSRTKKAHKSEPHLHVGKLVDDGKVLNLLKTDSIGHSKKQDVLLEDKTLLHHDNDLSKLISFSQVQKKPRSSLAKRNRQIDLVDQGCTKAKRTLEVDSEEAYKIAMEKGSNLGHIKSLVCVMDNARLPIKKRDKASFLQPNNNMDEQHLCRKDHPWKATMEFNDVADDDRITSSLKSYPSGDLEIKKDADQQIRKGDIDLLKLVSANASRKPRTISRKKPNF